jgi:hypothetical protein
MPLTTRFTVILLFILIMGVSEAMGQLKDMTPEQVVQANLDCYNRRDIDGFMSYFSPDIKMYNFTDNSVTIDGLEQYRKVYKELFDLSPNLYSTIVKRIVFDNKVIDHESIVGRRGSDGIFEIVLIYEVKDNKIYKITAIRK